MKKLSLFLMLFSCISSLQGMRLLQKNKLFFLFTKRLNHKYQEFQVAPSGVLSDPKIAFQALEDNDVKLFRAVLPLLPDLHVRDGLFEETFLHRAISLEREEFVQMLLAEKSFNRSIKCLGLTPQQWAELLQKEKMMKFFP